MTGSPDVSTTLAVLKETLANRPAQAMTASSVGLRALRAMQSTGWTQTARRLSIEEIIQISAVIVCADVISQDIAKTSFRMYEHLRGGGKREVEANQHPVAALLKTEPNQHHTWYEFFLQLLLHLVLVQNAFVAKRQTMDGVIEELIPVLPARTTILAIEPNAEFPRGMYAYQVVRSSNHERIMLADLPEFFLADSFIHFRGRMFDGLTGYSNIEAGAKTFGLSDALTEYQVRLFANDAQTRGVFQMGEESGDSLSDEAFQRLRLQLAEQMRNFREFSKPIVLEEGMEFKAIAMNAEQAEVAKARDAAVVDVARTFRVPPHKIMHLINVKYENMETLERSYVMDTLIPYAKPIEQRMARSLLKKEERKRFFFEFDRKEMMLNDPQKLAEVTKTLGGMGALEIDDMRGQFGWNPLANNAGQVRLIPSTYNAVDRKNNVVIAAGAQPIKDDGDDEAKKDDKAETTPEKVAPEAEIFQFPTVIGEK